MPEDQQARTSNNKDERIEETDPLIGCVLSGKYRILEKIGEGGMSVVYKAHDQLLDRPVAIKCLSGKLEAEGLTRFRREGIATGKLENPHIVNVHELYLEPDQTPYLVMDYVQGEPLSLIIGKEGAMPIERAIHIVRQAAEALEHAHGRGIIHRDIKPSNLIVTKFGGKTDFIKLLDFGIAKLLTPGEHGQKLTQAGDVFGSPMYMSPEQCSGLQVDARSDIYSLGCLFYEMLIGEPPLVGENALQTIRKHMEEQPPRPSAIRPVKGLSTAMENVIMKCLQKEPRKRYQNLRSFISDLNKEEAAAQAATSSFLHSEFRTTKAWVITAALVGIGLCAFIFSRVFHPAAVKPVRSGGTVFGTVQQPIVKAPLAPPLAMDAPGLTTSTAHETPTVGHTDTPMARELKNKEDDAENDMENHDFKKAETKLFNLLPMAVSVYGGNTREYALVLERLVAAAANAHDFAYAERTANLAIGIHQNLNEDHGVARMNAWIGSLEHKQGKDTQAMDYFNKSFSSGFKTGHSLMLYADFLKDLNRNQEAETRYYEALDIADKDHNYKSGKNILKHLQTFYKATKRPAKFEEAKKLEAQYLQKWNVR
jgi:serine/threonine protein kinase